ncbi:MAG: GCN5 family acetyltransferase [Saprospiraceae bacterium]|nr:GCN5 family acetyltransferase [Saprospiraceae bacterium]
MYPHSIDKNMVGEYPARAKSGGGYFYDQILEYRVWCRPWKGAPDEFDGKIYYYAFHTYGEALEFSNATKGSEDPLVLIKQFEWVDEPETGKFIHKTDERQAEWLVEWLIDSERQNDTIAKFIGGNGI